MFPLALDVTAGLQQQERVLARLLRQARKPVVLAINKCGSSSPPSISTLRVLIQLSHSTDNEKLVGQAGVFKQLGLGEPFTLSAKHNLGVSEMFGELTGKFKAEGFIPTVRIHAAAPQNRNFI